MLLKHQRRMLIIHHRYASFFQRNTKGQRARGQKEEIFSRSLLSPSLPLTDDPLTLCAESEISLLNRDRHRIGPDQGALAVVRLNEQDEVRSGCVWRNLDV